MGLHCPIRGFKQSGRDLRQRQPPARSSEDRSVRLFKNPSYFRRWDVKQHLEVVCGGKKIDFDEIRRGVSNIGQRTPAHFLGK
jgi:hypothetical protein